MGIGKPPLQTQSDYSCVPTASMGWYAACKHIHAFFSERKDHWIPVLTNAVHCKYGAMSGPLLGKKFMIWWKNTDVRSSELSHINRIIHKRNNPVVPGDSAAVYWRTGNHNTCKPYVMYAGQIPQSWEYTIYLAFYPSHRTLFILMITQGVPFEYPKVGSLMPEQSPNMFSVNGQANLVCPGALKSFWMKFFPQWHSWGLLWFCLFSL